MPLAFVVLTSWSSEARRQTSGARLVNPRNDNSPLREKQGTSGHASVGFAGLRLGSPWCCSSAGQMTGCSTFTRRVHTFHWCTRVSFIIHCGGTEKLSVFVTFLTCAIYACLSSLHLPLYSVHWATSLTLLKVMLTVGEGTTDRLVGRSCC